MWACVGGVVYSGVILTDLSHIRSALSTSVLSSVPFPSASKALKIARTESAFISARATTHNPVIAVFVCV
jgi:hypothetical protein